jgi:hypothetical protein
MWLQTREILFSCALQAFIARYAGFKVVLLSPFQVTARGANLYGALRHNCNNRKYDASKLRIPHTTDFLRKLSAIWARALKNVRQPCPRSKKFIEYRI